MTGDNIYKVLIYFDKLYSTMNGEEQRKLMEALIEEIQIYEERQPNGQWLKSITFRLPIIEDDMKIVLGDGLDNDVHIETVCLLSNRKPDSHIKLSLDVDEYYDIIEKEEAEKK